MADYEIAVDESATHRTLTADQVDSVTFVGRQVGEVTILVHPGGSAPVWVTVDGSTPEVSGVRSHPVWPGNSAVLPGGLSSRTLDGLDGDQGGGQTVVRLVSAGAQSYTVEA